MFMLNCRQVTRLVSQSLDTKVRWHERLAMRIHLLYCVWCRRYAAQLRFLRRASQELGPAAGETASYKLSGEAREDIRQRLQAALTQDPPHPG